MKFCGNPFNTLHVHPASYITCCPSWFTSPLEVMVEGRYENLWKVWNHEKFQKLRESWLNQDNSLCKNCVLPLLENNATPIAGRVDPPIKSYMTPVMTRGPSVIVFSNDMTCNLHCWSCRSKPIIEKRQDEIFRQTKNVLDTFHDSIKFISAIGSGDPLASPAWLKILQTFDIEKYDNLDIELFTNGLLIPKYWDSLSHLHDNITRIKMSIDAASKDIYEKTRLGGKFEDMDRAMKFISELGKDFIVNMVVESDNFTDIPLFIERAIDHNSTRVNLTMLRNWPDIRGGTATFKEKSLANVNHPKYEEFLKLLQNNEDLLSHPIVDASRIRPEGHAIIQQ
mgnify:FL=1|tara:strand:+ start:318 stop:1334 length:1017 start_codon:yes stop_codon:yes gene_type:complete